MKQINNNDFNYPPATESQIKPTTNKSIWHKIYSEVINDYYAIIVLKYISQVFLIPKSTLTPEKIIKLTVYAPVNEEILFRGLIPFAIRAVQVLLSKLSSKKIKESAQKQHEAAQKIYRVQCSSFIFACAQLSNFQKSNSSSLAQFTLTYIGGLNFSYLFEKNMSFTYPILFHGIHNILAVGARVYSVQYSSFFLVLILINQLTANYLGKTNEEGIVDKSEKSLKSYSGEKIK